MIYPVHFAQHSEELEKILQLRYRILREPWNQPLSSATDELESTAYNAFVQDEKQELLACGRLQINDQQTGQIRYMAVTKEQQGKGLGKVILQALEKKAMELGLHKIELQARENAVRFYENNGYKVEQKSFLLWDQIQHYRMSKTL